MIIRVADITEAEALADVARQAFPDEDVAGLIEPLMTDADFIGELNLVAEEDGQLLGHVLFTAARAGHVRAALLAPLGVIPERQNSGVGSALVRESLARARELGFGLALVLGHPGYYPRFGFEPASPWGIEAPHSIDPPEAWMAVELEPGSRARACGVVHVAATWAPAELWRE